MFHNGGDYEGLEERTRGMLNLAPLLLGSADVELSRFLLLLCEACPRGIGQWMSEIIQNVAPGSL